MILRKVSGHWLHELPNAAGLCLVLPGALLLRPEDMALPLEWTSSAPRFILCSGCDPYLERVLNERGVAVLTPLDPLDVVPNEAEVDLDPAAGALIEVSSGRRFALRPLKPSHLAVIQSHD
ncbi:MAG: hypothetical protein KF754_15505 [Planctomycetes bacterium]|nr:hypothetical protein [Planctomycetota bacterium]